MHYMSIFGLQILKAIVVFQMSSFKFVKMQTFQNKNKNGNFETTNGLFGYFWARSLKNIVVFQMSTSKFVKMQIFVQKQK